MAQSDFLGELEWRGMLMQQTEGAARMLSAGPVSAYCGFDPTGASLHVGSLVPIMGLVHLQRTGHRPVALIGGGTGMIGDPSGKTAERTLQTADQVVANAESIGAQLARFLDFSGPRGAVLRNNADWLMTFGAIEFMRDVGKHLTVNYMAAKESVKSRMEAGISYTEFSYMLLQAYDFVELRRRDGVTMQVGGSDQWGNMTAGVELVRRMDSVDACAVTFPLLTTASGNKFGKTEAGAVWLDAERTSPYQFYQFWINTDDRDAGKYLRMMTLLDRDTIASLEYDASEHPERREAQSALAFEITSRVHGAEAASIAREVSGVLFARGDTSSLSSDALVALAREVPGATVARGDQLSVLDLFTTAGLVKSKGEARRLVDQGGAYVNGTRAAASTMLAEFAPLAGSYLLLRKGARDYAVIRIQR
ncbi:MAG: tyrosine--tRNA ligase [Gemmatimonadota bacterium]|nr:tyrosine--tRNA ligase [Gemmatimonadota bacterium]